MLISALAPTTKQRAFVHGDVDSDGDPDLVVSDPERAQLTFFLEEDGQFNELTTPSLAGVQSMAMDLAGGMGSDPMIDVIQGLLGAIPPMLKKFDLEHTVSVIRINGNRWSQTSIW